MSDEDAFISAILDDPENPGPALIYADWLQERGDPRSEYIRIQCNKRNHEHYGYTNEDEQTQREHELFKSNANEWRPEELAPYNPKPLHWAPPEWHSVSLTPSQFHSQWKELKETAPHLRGLRIIRSDNDDPAQYLPRLLENEDFRQLYTLNLRFNDIGDTDMLHLAQHVGKFQHLHTLNLGYNYIGHIGAQHLARHAGEFKHLHTLDLGDNDIGDTGVRALARRAGDFKQLRTLNLAYNFFGDTGARALARSDFPELRDITVDINNRQTFAKTLSALRNNPDTPITLTKLKTINGLPLSHYGIPTVAEAQAIRGQVHAPSGGVTPSDVVGGRESARGF